MSVKTQSAKKSFDFAVRTVKLYKHLTENKQERLIAKQLLRCGTSIGANVSEAEQGQTKADFTAKMHIALKEANETSYWLRLLYATEYLSKAEYESINQDIREILKLLTSICKTANQNIQSQKNKNQILMKIFDENVENPPPLYIVHCTLYIESTILPSEATPGMEYKLPRQMRLDPGMKPGKIKSFPENKGRTKKQPKRHKFERRLNP